MSISCYAPRRLRMFMFIFYINKMPRRVELKFHFISTWYGFPQICSRMDEVVKGFITAIECGRTDIVRSAVAALGKGKGDFMFPYHWTDKRSFQIIPCVDWAINTGLFLYRNGSLIFGTCSTICWLCGQLFTNSGFSLAVDAPFHLPP